MAGALSDSALEEGEKFFCAIGRALTTWSGIEFRLCTLYAAVLDSQPVGAMAQAFWVVPSFQSKLSMTDAVVSADFGSNEKIWAEWVLVRDRLAQLNRRRNKIAHGTVVSFVKEIGKSDLEVFFAPFYWGAIADSKAFSKMRKKPSIEIDVPKMRLKDLADANADFEAIGPKLAQILTEVHAFKRSGSE